MTEEAQSLISRVTGVIDHQISESGIDVGHTSIGLKDKDEFPDDHHKCFKNWYGRTHDHRMGLRRAVKAYLRYLFLYDSTVKNKDSHLLCVSPFISDTVYCSKAFGEEKDKPYHVRLFGLEQPLGHEVVHLRLQTQYAEMQTGDEDIIYAMLNSEVPLILREGIADYYSIESFNHEIDQSYISPYHSAVKLSHLTDEISDKMYNLSKTDLCWTGLIFMAKVAKHLSEEHAVGLAINPFQDGIDPKSLTAEQIKKSTGECMKVTLEELKQPSLYINRQS